MKTQHNIRPSLTVCFEFLSMILDLFFLLRYPVPAVRQLHDINLNALGTHKNSLSFDQIGLSGSSSTSCTSNIFPAVFMNVKSALLLLLKQK